MILAILGNIQYARGGEPGWVIVGRVLAGMGSCGAVLTHKFIEYSSGGDEVVIRSRMVMIGGVQTIGSILGVVLATAMASIPDFDLLGFKSTSQQPIAAIIVAGLYLILLPGVWMTYDSLIPSKAVIDHVDSVKGELDAPPSNFMSSQRLGVIVPALVYDRGQVQPSSLPDVFSTAVILVVYFLMNNLIVGVEVAHGPICTDLFKWGARDISITYLAFLLAGVVGILLCLSLSDEVPCNRRLFGSMVMCFVTYGLMLQPSTPKEQYIAFLVLLGASYYVADLSVTEIHVDKIGEDEDKRMTASNKLMVMSWLNSMATFARIGGAIVTGYIYDYYSSESNLARRPYAIYGCGFGVVMLLVMMCVIFYKRFQFRFLDPNQNPNQPPAMSEKEMLKPQVINCIVDF